MGGTHTPRVWTMIGGVSKPKVSTRTGHLGCGVEWGGYWFVFIVKLIQVEPTGKREP